MRTKHLSFQLEETYLGTFLLQGWFGGILTGFVYTVATCYWHNWKFTDAAQVSIYLAILGGIIGVMKSTIMWGTYRLTRIQPHAVVRVVIASLGSAFLAYVLGILFGSGRRNDTVAWVLTILIGGLPTAILIGSSVKPWELFTFGSIAVGDSRTGGRVGSKSVLATLGTLPLRFLSLLALALWILACACEFKDQQDLIGCSIVFFVPFTYLSYSAYVTFKSPHRFLLLVSGIALNLPVGFVTYIASIIHPGSYLYNEMFPYVAGIGSAFVIAWSIFLTARLTVPIQRTIRESHGCLGSRFMEWQELHAQ